MSGALRTTLRATYERLRALDLEAQVRECVEWLENPVVLASELHDALAAVEEYGELAAEGSPRDPAEEELLLDRFAPGREIGVEGEEEGFALTCLASGILPLEPGGRPRSEHDGAGALDYVGAVAFPAGRFALGAMESAIDASPFVLLVKTLSALAEMSPQAQVERLDRELFKGALGDAPIYDLHLVSWRRQPDDPADALRGALDELARDLAEASHDAVLGTPLEVALGDVVALELDPADIEGRFVERWRV